MNSLVRPPRYSKRAFPAYTHRPGLTPHPNSPEGHSANKTERASTPLVAHQFYEHEDYLYGIDLLNHGLFWESHVLFEAIWNAHARQGAEAQVMKALIKWAAAGIKEYAHAHEAARGHLLRAQELLIPLDPEEVRGFCGLDLNQWLHEIERMLNAPHLLDENSLLPPRLLS